MEINHIELMSKASTKDVDFLLKLKNDLSDTEYNTLIFETLNKYIENKKIINKVLELGTHTWEISVILEMQKEPWFSESLLFLTNAFRNLMHNEKEKSISIIEEIYPVLHESLACWHDAFFFQEHLDSSNPRYATRACFRMLGDTVESVHGPHINFIYRMFINAPDSPIFHRPNNVSFGKAVSNLIEIKEFEKLYKSNIYGVSLSQWRNIAHHSNYKYDSATNKIICTYGANKKLSIHITIQDLLNLLSILNKLQALQKIAIGFFMIEFLDDIDFEKMGKLDITIETIVSQIGNNLGVNGYNVISAKDKSKTWVFKIEDSHNRGVSKFKLIMPKLSSFLMMLKEKGYEPVFELFDRKGNKLTEARVKMANK